MKLRSKRTINEKSKSRLPETSIQAPRPVSPVVVSKEESQFTNLKTPGAFAEKFKKFLQKNTTYSVHKQVRKKFKRRRIFTYYPYQIMEMDLVDFRNISNYNHGWNYILVIIDLFSKTIWLEKMKTKSGPEVCDSIKNCFARMEMPPQTVIFDEGLEFYNKYVDQLFLQYNIHYYSIKTITKASAAERVIKTIKSLIYKYFTQNNTKKWTGIVTDIESNYNDTWHSSIKMAPNDVTWKNRKLVFKTLFPQKDAKIKCKLKENDKVRILLHKSTFEKSYTKNWSEQIYTISRVYKRGGVCWYKLTDAAGVPYPKKKYYYQLNLVASSS